MAQLKLRNPFDEATTTAPIAADEAGETTEETPADSEIGQAPVPTIRLSVDLDRRLHRRLRRWALEQERTASDVIRDLLTSALDAAGH